MLEWPAKNLLILISFGGLIPTYEKPDQWSGGLALKDVGILETFKSQPTITFNGGCVSVGWLYQDSCSQQFSDANPPLYNEVSKKSTADRPTLGHKDRDRSKVAVLSPP